MEAKGFSPPPSGLWSCAYATCWTLRLETFSIMSNERIKRGSTILASDQPCPQPPGSSKAAQRFVARWQRMYPKAVDCLQKDLPEFTHFLQIKTKLAPSSYVPPMRLNDDSWRCVEEPDDGTFSDRTSMERILFSVFTYENLKQRTATPFLLLTQNN